MLLEDYLQLKKRPYKVGVSIFCAMSKNETLKQLFSSGENSFTTKKLHQELQKIADARNTGKIVKAEIEKKIDSGTAPSHPKFTNFKENIPEILQPFHDLANATYKERALLHNKLCESASHELDNFDRKRNYEGERKEIQDKMLALIATNEKCWDTIFYYNEHGQLPPADEEDVFDITTKTVRELVNAEKVIPSYITKLNHRLSKTEFDSDKYLSITNDKLKYEMRLKEIKTAIDKLPIYGKIKEVVC